MADGGRVDGEGIKPPPPLSAAEIAAAAALAFLFIAIRVPLLTDPGAGLGWNSDAAIFGLMARGIVDRGEFPIYFWGQSYMGPLTAWITVAASPIAGGVTALALRLAATAMVLAALAFWWLTLRRMFSPSVAVIVMAWLITGPAYLFHFTVAPIGAEQMFLLSAVLAWVAVRTELRTHAHWLTFGVLAGFGWWINQGVVFVVGAVLLVHMLRSAWWADVRRELRIVERLTLRHYDLEPRTRIALHFVQILLALLLITGFLASLQVDVPSLWVHWPLGEPVMLFAASHLAIALWRRRAPLPRPSGRIIVWFLTGFLAGYSPVLIAKATGHAFPKYGFSAPFLPLADFARHLAAVAGDFWRFIGVEAPSVVAIIVPAVLTAVFRKRHAVAALGRLESRSWGSRAIGALVVLAGIAFYLFSQRAYPGTMRYVVSALPFVFAVAAEEMLRWRWRLGTVVAAAIAIVFMAARLADVREVTAGRREGYANFAGRFDPRPTLSVLATRDCRIVFADYWISYKLELLGNGRFATVPWRSYDRRPDLTTARLASGDKRCMVTPSGSVRPFTAEDGDGATSRAARERLRRQGAENQASRPPL